MRLLDAAGDAKKSRLMATRKSSLEMKLHRLNFVELLRRCGSSNGDVITGSLEAVRYARAHFASFVDGHEQEVFPYYNLHLTPGPFVY